ncbi:hypothetical protein [Acinetobacter piscicola]|uniref:hypothetical protein n=1 Tax=Acinetobacter piscicola TaxID=2006115 RepID=UPI001D18DC5A|nr:hypothetical protein [Acinetobacter piscicola]
MNRYSGRSIVDDIQLPAHLFQSIYDIFTTPKGTRLCRRNYGSLIPDLIDRPCNEITQLQIMNASASSIIEFEPHESKSVQLWSANLKTKQAIGKSRFQDSIKHSMM